MDEFVKRLYDFMGIYRIFWSQNSYYRYLPIFFRNSSTSARVPQSRFFGGKIGIFRFFGEKSAILPIFPLIDFSSAFSSQCRSKTNFSVIYWPKKPIFLSLVKLHVGCCSKVKNTFTLFFSFLLLFTCITLS